MGEISVSGTWQSRGVRPKTSYRNLEKSFADIVLRKTFSRVIRSFPPKRRAEPGGAR